MTTTPSTDATSIITPTLTPTPIPTAVAVCDMVIHSQFWVVKSWLYKTIWHDVTAALVVIRRIKKELQCTPDLLMQATRII